MNNQEIKIESLISTMGTDPVDLMEKMNIQTNAVLINQHDKMGCQYIQHQTKDIRVYNFLERGVGRSRNEALMRARADVCLMADDDMVYVENYPEIVKAAYKRYPEADLIVFNVRIHMNGQTIEKVKKSGKVNYFNSLRYGTVTFTFKRESILKENIFFSLLFGGGARYSNGEDSLFLWDCLKKGLKIYTVTDTIADVYNDDSSWFTGHNDKFFFDRGALFKALSSKHAHFLIYQYALRKHKNYKDEMSKKESIRLMLQGAEDFKKNNRGFVK